MQAKASGEAAPGLGAFAFLAWAGPQQELRLHSDEARASQRLPEANGAPLGAYESPLLTFHTYRCVQAARWFAVLRLMCGGAPLSWSTCLTQRCGSMCGALLPSRRMLYHSGVHGNRSLRMILLLC